METQDIELLEEETKIVIGKKEKALKSWFEMNIPFDMTMPDDKVQQAEVVQFICNGINDGYTAFVLTHTINHELSPKDVWTFDVSSLNIKERYNEYKPESLPTYKEFNVTASIEKVQIYTRLHVQLKDQKQAHWLMNSNCGSSNEKSGKILHTYDIISASTDDEKILELLIKKSDVDIITMDYWEQLKFFFNRKLLKQTIEK